MRKFWKIAPGRLAAFWRECYTQKCIAVDLLHEFDLSGLHSEQDFSQLLTAKDQNPSANAISLQAFVNDIQVGDVVFANDGRSRCRGIGVVKSDYLQPFHRLNPFSQQQYKAQVRLMEWVVDRTVEMSENFFDDQLVQQLESHKVLELKLSYLRSLHRPAGEIETLIPLEILDVKGESPDQSTDTFQPTETEEREAILQQIRVRRGQQAFREALLLRYGGKCVVTGCEVEAVLEAAHINPYRGVKDQHAANGLLLRADIHTLFDLHKIGINPEGFQLMLSEELERDPTYLQYKNRQLSFSGSSIPSIEALRLRFQIFQTENSRDAND